MSSSSISGLGKSYYTYGKKAGSSASDKKSAKRTESALSDAVSTGTNIVNESGDSISLSRPAGESVAAESVTAQADIAAEAAVNMPGTGAEALPDAETSEKINSMLDEAEKVANLYEQALSQMSAFSDFMKASLSSESGASNLYKALGLDSTSTFTSAMSSLQDIVNERYTSLSDSILSAAEGAGADAAASVNA